MRKTIVLISCICFICCLVGCAGNSASTEPTKNTKQDQVAVYNDLMKAFELTEKFHKNRDSFLNSISSSSGYYQTVCYSDSYFNKGYYIDVGCIAGDVSDVSEDNSKEWDQLKKDIAKSLEELGFKEGTGKYGHKGYYFSNLTTYAKYVLFNAPVKYFYEDISSYLESAEKGIKNLPEDASQREKLKNLYIQLTSLYDGTITSTTEIETMFKDLRFELE